MPGTEQQLLQEFVNREKEMGRFLEFIDNDTETVLAIWGVGGIGKSSFMAKMFHECALRNMPRSEVSWADRSLSYLEVMRKIRDSFKPELFDEFTDLANYFTVAHYDLKIDVKGLEKISILENAKLENVEIGKVAAISIQDLMIAEPRADMQIPESERRTRLTDNFLKGLATVCHQGAAIIFFDAAEKMTGETENWLWKELLSIPLKKKCGNIKFVICGRKQPQLDRSWRQAAVVRELQPLTEEHIIAYLEKRGVKSAINELAKILAITTKGNMLQIANLVDVYQEPKPSKDGW